MEVQEFVVKFNNLTKNLPEKEIGDYLHISQLTISRWKKGLNCPYVKIRPLVIMTLEAKYMVKKHIRKGAVF